MSHYTQLYKAATLCKLAEAVPDNSRIDFISGLIGSNALSLGGSLAGKALTNIADDFVSPLLPGQRRGFAALYDRIRAHKPEGWTLMNSPTTFDKNRGLNFFTKVPEWAGSGVIPKSKRIITPGSNPYMLAHELGHVQAGKFLGDINVLGKRVLGLGALGTMFSNDRDFAEGTANIASGGGLATLISELDASHRGAKILDKAGVRGAGKLKSYAGVPTYVLAALLPQIGFHAKDKLKGYDRNKESLTALGTNP
jgi:hypothetical protein